MEYKFTCSILHFLTTTPCSQPSKKNACFSCANTRGFLSSIKAFHYSAMQKGSYCTGRTQIFSISLSTRGLRLDYAYTSLREAVCSRLTVHELALAPCFLFVGGGGAYAFPSQLSPLPIHFPSHPGLMCTTVQKESASQGFLLSSLLPSHSQST